MGPDPGVASEVLDGQQGPAGQPVAGREQDPGRVGEQRHQLDVVGRRVGLEAVLEHQGHVQLPGGQPPEGGAAVDQLVLHRELGQPGLGEGAHLGGELGEGGEEGAQADPAAAQPGQLGQLLGGQGQPVEDGVGVLDQQPAGLGRPDPLAGAAQQLGAGLAFQQGDLAGHGRLGQSQGLAGGRERPVGDHRAQGREPADVEHAQSLER
jgi:hypothetical protein